MAVDMTQNATQDPRQQTAESLAEYLAAALTADLAASPEARALLVVSGGSTPKPLFAALRDKPLDWSRVDITLADERWVSEDADDSNARFVREHLLKGAAAAATFHPLTNAEAEPEAGCEEVSARIAALSWPASAVIIGMGGDGHTASLFPDGDRLQEALTSRDCCVPMRAPSVPQARITLSLERLRQTRRTVLHLTGTDKQAVLSRALGDVEAVSELPIRAFLSAPLALYWAP
ncbi:6-phosphogluconolactonase [Cobetia marina]|uniref:6-phosphogluconolactonase n=1 Tax=Cobetia marina TaxID=28258 RepID=UPI002546879B|nr:6-phosphogluconolactonase [Cobetia pacifica]MDI6003904.1 6-phosphogluconolactonase [Cobetia pacifica]